MMNETETHFHIAHLPEHNAYGLWMRQIDIVEGVASLSVPVPSSLVMKPHKSGDRVDPLLYMNKVQAQSLADALWDSGIRPTQAGGEAGALKATQDHLADMRTLVFKKGDHA